MAIITEYKLVIGDLELEFKTTLPVQIIELGAESIPKKE